MSSSKPVAGDDRECPRCGLPVPASSRGLSIDRPILECARCGGIVLRPGVTEWDLLRAEQKAGLVARHALVALAVGPALALVPLALELAAGRTLEGRDVLAWLVGGWILAVAWQISRLATRIRQSRRRMSDPMYLAKRVEHEIADATRR